MVPSPHVLSTDEMGRIAPPIFTSVGQDGVNSPGDVFVIQSLLNDRLPKPHSPVPVTGVADPGTMLAIEAYQAVMMNMNPPSGHVEPGSPTYYSLAARPLVDEPAADAFRPFRPGPPEVIEAAIASRKHWNVPASITLAQWVVESAWGAAMPPDSNNPFGIKALACQHAGGERHPRGGQRRNRHQHRRRDSASSTAWPKRSTCTASCSHRPPYMAAMTLGRTPRRSPMR